MKRFSETDDSQPESIPRVVDLVATVGVMGMIAGIVLLILFPPESFGATSLRDLGASASVTTTSESFQGPKRLTFKTMDKMFNNLNLDRKHVVTLPSQVKEIPGIGGNCSENKISTDKTSVPLLAPWH